MFVIQKSTGLISVHIKMKKRIAFLVENSDTDKVDDTEGVNIVLTTDKFHKAEIFVVKYLNLPAQ